ncbi:hypothetical protein M422DRAFT_243771 [Sphaerobolus stellatus SS14]|nr:hypothetical protein M422DRAFT_243771 [Sphaerobolus stellatus SS14]
MTASSVATVATKLSNPRSKPATAKSINNELKEAITFHITLKDNASLNCISKIKVPVTEVFKDVLTQIHNEIGCLALPVCHLPEIMLHFSKDVKSQVWPLKSADNWNNAKETWELEVQKKQKAACVEVILDPKWQTDFSASKKMKAAHSKSSSDKAVTLGSNCGSKVAAHATVIDFYAASDTEEDIQTGDDNEFTSAIAAKQAELDKSLKDCNACNANKNLQDKHSCLVNKNGMHKVISHEMIKVWVLALVKNELGVTLMIPLKKDPFIEFH